MRQSAIRPSVRPYVLNVCPMPLDQKQRVLGLWLLEHQLYAGSRTHRSPEVAEAALTLKKITSSISP